MTPHLPDFTPTHLSALPDRLFHQKTVILITGAGRSVLARSLTSWRRCRLLPQRLRCRAKSLLLRKPSPHWLHWCRNSPVGRMGSTLCEYLLLTGVFLLCPSPLSHSPHMMSPIHNNLNSANNVRMRFLFDLSKLKNDTVKI